MVLRIPVPSLIILVGASGSGKSTWAAERFRAAQVVSSDRLRAAVGVSEHDQRASKDAFELLDAIVDKRLKRGLTTVVDSTALEVGRRDRYRDIAAKHGLPCVAVVFDTPAAECRARNRARDRPVPDRVLRDQLRTYAAVRLTLADEGFDAVHTSDAHVALVPHCHTTSDLAARRQETEPMTQP